MPHTIPVDGMLNVYFVLKCNYENVSNVAKRNTDVAENLSTVLFL